MFINLINPTDKWQNRQYTAVKGELLRIVVAKCMTSMGLQLCFKLRFAARTFTVHFPTSLLSFVLSVSLLVSFSFKHQHDHHSHCHPPARKAVVREDGGVRKEIAYMLLLIRVARTAVEMRSGVANSQSRLRANFTQLQSLAGRGGEAQR